MQGSSRSERVGFGTALVAIAVLVAGMWLLEGIDQASSNALDAYGIRPRTGEGLSAYSPRRGCTADGGTCCPTRCRSWCSASSSARGLAELGSGHPDRAPHLRCHGVAAGADELLTLGASGIVFGWLVYLLARGFFTGSPGQIATGVVVFLFYGGMLWGVLPTDVGVSWQAHLGGALGGLLAARSRGRALRPRPPDACPRVLADQPPTRPKRAPEHRRAVPKVHQNTAEPSQRCRGTALLRRLGGSGVHFCDGSAARVHFCDGRRVGYLISERRTSQTPTVIGRISQMKPETPRWAHSVLLRPPSKSRVEE